MVDVDDVRTMMGVSPEHAAEFMVSHGCDILALNCGTFHRYENSGKHHSSLSRN